MKIVKHTHTHTPNYNMKLDMQGLYSALRENKYLTKIICTTDFNLKQKRELKLKGL